MDKSELRSIKGSDVVHVSVDVSLNNVEAFRVMMSVHEIGSGTGQIH